MVQSSLEANSYNMFRVWGGEGEREGEPSVTVEVNPEPKPESKPKPKPDSDTDAKADAKSDGGDDSDTRIRDLEAKYDAEKKQRIKLEREKDKALTEAIEGAENVEAERDAYKEKYEKLLKYVESDAIDSAILKNSKYEWHDVEAVRAFIDRNNIRLDIDNGVIDGIDMELKRIAKEKPYMLVERQETKQEDFEPKDKRGTGTHPFGGSTSQRETDRAKLGAKYKIPGFGPGSSARPM